MNPIIIKDGVNALNCIHNQLDKELSKTQTAIVKIVDKVAVGVFQIFKKAMMGGKIILHSITKPEEIRRGIVRTFNNFINKLNENFTKWNSELARIQDNFEYRLRNWTSANPLLKKGFYASCVFSRKI